MGGQGARGRAKKGGENYDFQNDRIFAVRKNNTLLKFHIDQKSRKFKNQWANVACQADWCIRIAVLLEVEPKDFVHGNSGKSI